MTSFNWTTYLVCALGVAISIVLPIIRSRLPKPPEGLMGGVPQDLRSAAKPYLWLGAFSLVVAILIVAGFADTLNDWRAALAAGYAFDSTLQKLKPFG